MKKALTLLLLAYSLVLWGLHDSATLRSSTVMSWMGENLPLPEGGSFIFWRDTIMGDYDIYAQRIGANGEPVWAEPCGVVIKPGNQSIASCVLSTDGNYILTWYENGYWGQMISPSGQKLWPEEGLLLSQEYCSLAPNASGGAFLARSEYGVLKAKSLNQQGSNLWNEGWRTLATFEDEFEIKALFPDGSGGLWVHIGFIYGPPADTPNLILHFDADGTQIASQISVYPLVFPQPDFQVLALANNEFLVYSCSSEDNLIQSLCLQKIDANGSPLLPVPMIHELAIASSEFSSNFTKITIKSSSNSSLLLSWNYQVSLGSYQYRMQKFDSALSKLWNSSGLIVTPGLSSGSFSFYEDTDSTVYCSWKEIRPDENHRLRAQKISSTGILAWNEYGEILDTGTSWFSGAVTIRCNSVSAYVWYADEAGEERLKIQKLDATGSALLPQSGAVVQSQLGGYCRNPKTVFLGDRIITLWEDFRPENNGIYYQISNTAMQNLLPENGNLLIPPGISHPVLTDVRLMANNQVAIFYCFSANEVYMHYLQIMDATGALLLPGLGQHIAEFTGFSPNFDVAGSDIYTAWTAQVDSSNLIQLKAQRYVAGNPVWGSSGKVIALSSVGFSNIKVKERYFVWYIWSGNSRNIYVQHVDENGYIAPGWGNNPLALISANASEMISDRIGLDGSDLICYFRQQTYPGWVLRAQKISQQGERLWGEQGILLFETEYSINMGDAIFGSGSTAVWATNTTDPQIYLQKLDSSGNFMFGEQGCVFQDISRGMTILKLYQNQNGWYTAVWGPVVDSNNDRDIRYRMISPTGIPAGTQNQVLCDAPFLQDKLHLCGFENKCAVVWEDRRWGQSNTLYSGTSIMAGLIHSDGSLVTDELNSPPLDIISLSNHPNPFKAATSISVELLKGTNLDLKIYNLRGQHIRSLASGEWLDKGVHPLVWDGRDANGKTQSSGIYFYEAKAGKQRSTGKMLLLK